ncbi:M23 family metallopeptidase [Candidatus Parcubacteria bacterium]|nr:MAG: M23 family metallopeptidase [Candidatus Parcubacteria bacterium]
MVCNGAAESRFGGRTWFDYYKAALPDLARHVAPPFGVLLVFYTKNGKKEKINVSGDFIRLYNIDMNKLIVILAVCASLLGAALWRVSHKKESSVSRPKIQEIQEEKILSEPEISFSSLSLEQADTLVIKVFSSEKPSTIFNDKRIDFFETASNSWVGIFGIDAKAKARIENIIISFEGDKDVQNEFVIIKKDWPRTQLYINPELTKQGYTPQSISQNLFQNEDAIIGIAVSDYKDFPYFSGSFEDPLDKRVIVGAFGNVRVSQGVALQHLGVDLEGKMGDRVYAINDGVITLSRSDLPNYGTTVVINHGLGIFSLYLHLSEIKVALGQKVKRGDVIGLVGSTGYSLEPHLHLSLRVRGASVDPLKFIETVNQIYK